jgi:molybdopterin-guanine dinucleotide biosynthesis protein A
VVLCGGKSSRMGRPKAWLDFAGEPLLVRVLGRVSAAACPIVAVAAPGQDLPALPSGVEVTRDETAERGPLEGIRAGLAALAALPSPPEAAFVSSTDVPFLAPEIIRRLASLRDLGDRRADVVVARVGGRFHPLCAVYALTTLPHVAALLAEDRLRPFFLFERVTTVVADESMLLGDPALAAVDSTLRSLQNVNTPEEYAAALAELDRGG